MRHPNILITLFVMLAFMSSVGQTQAALVDPLTTIELDTPVHFLAPDGSDLLIEAGTYAVEPAEEWIRVMSGERHDALLIEARKGTHELGLEQVMAMSVPGETEDEKDNHYVMLLLPGGQSLEATGTYSGIRARGFFKNTFKKVKKAANNNYKKARSKGKKAALDTKRHIEKEARKVASRVYKGSRKVASSVKKETKKLPKIRALSRSEKNLARSVFQNTINYDRVKITDTLGSGGRPWTTNTPPMYMINVGSDYPNLTANKERKRLLIHELTHVWQGQHLVPFMLNSGAHQSLSAINNGGDVASAYAYTVGKPWGQYNVEQQASIVAHWYTPTDICFKSGPCGGGMKTTDSRYRYIRDNIRRNKAN